MADKDKKLLHCSFCGKRQDEVRKIIAGPDVWICDECITLCYDIVKDDKREPDKGGKTSKKLPTPREIKEYLDQYVIGQDYAKQIVGVAVYNHYLRLQNPKVDDVELEKSNVIMFGPSGSGKTLIAQTIARMLDVPIAIADATTLTESGYVGDDVETIITRLLQVADYDVTKAERGIIFIDEIDKKAKRGDNASITRDVSGEGVQQALLKIIEGTECRVPPQGGRKHPAAEMVTVNTRNILFFVSGAFVGLDKIIQKRIVGQSSIGFNAQVKSKADDKEINDLLKTVESEDLIKFGLIPELVGRLPVIANLDELTEQQLIQVLTQPKNAITKQFKKIFKLNNVELDFIDSSLLAIAKIAKDKKTGARGLRSVIEQKLMEVQYRLPELHGDGVEKVIVTDRTINSGEVPEMVYGAPSQQA